MTSPILQTVPLGFQWATVDPFLFCVHHLDHYPASDGELGPAADLSGRSIGNDFEPTDGWRMYHGSKVPGFPQHPHRGFETISFVRQGLIDHADSLGAAARYGRGDVQWMTAGAGIQHAEMFPLVDPDGPNTMEMFQIWINLPASDKMVEPHFAMLWDHEIPRVVVQKDSNSPAATITVIAGELDGHTPPSPPPSSWASRPEADVALWHVVLEPGSEWTMPAAAGADTVRVLYVFDGDGLTIDDESVDGSTGAVVDAQRAISLRSTGHVELLMMQGRPIGEPVAQQGPFVMNDEAEIRQAFADYRATQFGGWPWDRPDPTHGHDGERFARHADGRVEKAVTV
ncbi:pirin family protein [Ilumatobacter coccineus]|uniref:Pirin family protein n=1 Tax=Ilumatobacter coccineus (strain NBRC 103263 / KCTC 29153 / YM16-304) TaxID=1313172 RepID=A0A6C7E3A3_ILUCY|nr:pirin family protein [Ilumatobacter coccineus]BAN01497.1 pirin family protein [Ilumatobacter coccineus YM16-304]